MIQEWDGYDHYNDATDWQARSSFIQYALAGGTAGVTFPVGLTGVGKSVLVASSNTNQSLCYTVFGQRVASAFIGFRVVLGAFYYTFEFWDSVTQTNQLTVLFRPDNFSIGVFRGNAFIGGTNYGGNDGRGPGTLLAYSVNNTWTLDTIFLELWPKINSSTGTFELFINGVAVASLTLSGQNTQESANAWWDKWYCNMTNPSNGLNWDDFYYGDTTVGPGIYPGSSPIGDCGTDTVFAIGNSSVQFTPLAGTNWGEVSETAMDFDTSYNFSSTVTNEDLLNFAALLSNTTLVYGVQITYAARKDDVGARSVKSALKSSTTEVYGSVVSLSQTYTYTTDQWILDPNTAANWTVGAVNALAAGYNVAA